MKVLSSAGFFPGAFSSVPVEPEKGDHYIEIHKQKIVGDEKQLYPDFSVLKKSTGKSHQIKQDL